MTRDRRALLQLRSRAVRAMRSFFHEQGFLETDTPVRLPAPALEEHIDALPAPPFYLRTSPELHMKRLLAEGIGPLFQIGPCFRADERGALHHPEFTMLEWYRRDSGYLEILADTRGLLCAVATAIHGEPVLFRDGQRVRLDRPWTVYPVREVFLAHAGWDPVADYDADRFDLDLVDKVEPALPRDVPVILRDYPIAAAALSRPCPADPRMAERWELYLHGIEIANAYSELTDPDEQRRRFLQCATARRAAGREVYPLDEAFLAALERGLPPCGGIALGVDRLVMLLADAADIGEVMAFRE